MTTRKATRSGAETRRRILNAAEELFVRYGYEGTRMDQIAEAAGVEKANIYYYFDGKESLYQALIGSIMDALVHEIRDFVLQPADSPWVQLDTFLDFFFTMVERYQGLVGLVVGEMQHPPRDQEGESPLLAIMLQIQSVAGQLLEDGMRQGHFRRQDPAQLLLSLEGALFYSFLLPEERMQALLGEPRFSPEGLARRREHLRGLLRMMLGHEDQPAR